MPDPHHISHILRPHLDKVKFKVHYYTEGNQSFMAVEGTLYHKDSVISTVTDRAWVDLASMVTSEQLKVLGQCRSNVIKMFENSALLPAQKPTVYFPVEVGDVTLLREKKLRVFRAPVKPPPARTETGWLFPPDATEDTGVMWRNDYAVLMVDRAPVRVGDIVGLKEPLYTTISEWSGSSTLRYRSGSLDVQNQTLARNYEEGVEIPAEYAPIATVRWKALVTSVKCERLGRMNETDVLATGMVPWDGPVPPPMSALARFRHGWDSKHENPTMKWAESPWVWVLGLEPIE